MFKRENFKSQVLVRNQFPFGKLDPENHILLYDLNLETKEDSDVNEFINSFTYRYGVKGGETLKNFKDFPKNLDLLLKKWPQPIRRSHTLVVLGGGTLGDFGGFVASILKRGVSLIQIPSTWLSAIDSAHGGKNGLNGFGAKNQIGTFYPPHKIFVIRDLLENSPGELKEQAYGELIKMGLIGDSQFFKEMAEDKRPAQDFFWRFVKFCIEDKYHVILQDPYETKKIRQVLNFGHTLGHAFESHFGWPHGDSVLQGIFFALEWSRYRGHLSQGGYQEIMQIISEKFERVPAYDLKWYRRPGVKPIEKGLMADKKMDSNGQIQFVFLRGIGKPLLKSVPVEDVISEAKRQGWLK